MTPTLEDHEQRITVLEHRVEAARVERDLIQALAKTQSEHTRTLAEHTQTLAEHTEKLDRLGREMGQLRSQVQNLHTGVQEVVGKLDLLIARENGR
jgi:phage shock protein A